MDLMLPQIILQQKKCHSDLQSLNTVRSLMWLAGCKMCHVGRGLLHVEIKPAFAWLFMRTFPQAAAKHGLQMQLNASSFIYYVQRTVKHTNRTAENRPGIGNRDPRPSLTCRLSVTRFSCCSREPDPQPLFRTRSLCNANNPDVWVSPAHGVHSIQVAWSFDELHVCD